MMAHAKRTCGNPSCANLVAPHHVLCNACWTASPPRLRKAFLLTRAGTTERLAAAEALVGVVQPQLPGFSSLRRGDQLTAAEMAAQASRFIGPPSAAERRRAASWAACDAFNAAHPLGSQLQALHQGGLVAVFVAGAAAALPPSWRASVVVRLKAESNAPTLQLPLESLEKQQVTT